MRAGARSARRRPRRDRRARARRRARQWRPRPARRLLHGEHGDASTSPPTATASATSTACSARRSSTAGRSSCPRLARRTAIRGSSSAARAAYEIGFGGSVEPIDEPDGASSATSGGRPSTCWPSPTTRRSSAGAASGSTRCGSGAREPIDPILLDAFNAGDHIGALAESNRAEALSRVLYPADSHAGRPGAAAAAGIFLLVGLAAGHPAPAPPAVRRPRRRCPTRSAIQLNDTHPAVAVAELMRLLIDVHGLDFDEAWEHHQAAPSPTPTTRCCPKRWRAGRCRCSSGCCRATCRSSTRSTPRCCSKRARNGLDDEPDRARSR